MTSPALTLSERVIAPYEVPAAGGASAGGGAGGVEPVDVRARVTVRNALATLSVDGKVYEVRVTAGTEAVPSR